MRPKVVALGEILVDMIPTELGHYRGVPLFEKCFGGAPFNFAIGIARLGGKAGAICAVGSDQFGEFLLETLKSNGVDTSGVKVKKARTTLAFVVRYARGERDFFFYRKPWGETADSLLAPGDIDPGYISGAEILHYSGVILSHDPAREATLKAVKIAKRAGVKVSFDLNIRSDLWKSEDELRRVYGEAMREADLILMAEEEVEGLFGKSDLAHVSRTLMRKYSPLCLAIRLGGEGCYLFTRGGEEIYEPALKVRVEDTTGAGDAWAAGFEEMLVEGLDLRDCAKIANAVAALSVTKVGAITALPTREEVKRFIRKRRVNVRLPRLKG